MLKKILKNNFTAGNENDFDSRIISEYTFPSRIINYENKKGFQIIEQIRVWDGIRRRYFWADHKCLTPTELAEREPEIFAEIYS